MFENVLNDNVLKIVREQLQNSTEQSKNVSTNQQSIFKSCNDTCQSREYFHKESTSSFDQNLQNRHERQENIFKPSKIIDYFHRHRETFEERMAEFKVYRVIDYNHKSTPKLKQFLKDVNWVKIRGKKVKILRKKEKRDLKKQQ